MNQVMQNGNNITQTNEYIEYNGVITYLPKHVKSTSNSMGFDNGQLIVNGYYFNPTTKEFKKPTVWQYIKSLFA